MLSKNRSRLAAVIALVAIALAVYVVKGRGEDPADTLQQLFADEWSARLAADPLFASYADVHDYDDRLPDPRPAAHEARLAQDQAFLDRLLKIKRRKLSPGDQLNYDLFRFVVENRVEGAKYRGWRVPLLSDSGFHTRILRMHEAMRFETAQDYERYIARLQAVPGYFAAHIQNMRLGMEEGFTMPRAILDNMAPSIAAQVVSQPTESVFYTPFKSMPDDIDEETANALRHEAVSVINDEVIPAYGRFLLFFNGEYKPVARETLGASALPDGDAYYRYLVRYYTTLDITPEEVHEIGLAEVARIRGEMEDIIKRVGFEGSFAEFLDFLRTDPQFYAKTPDELLKDAAWLAKTIDGKLPSLFGRLPRIPYTVEPVPEAIAPNYTTGRYVGPPEGGGRGGIYWVNTYALDKRPLYALPSLTLHEAVPGHHLQVALSMELEDVPRFRRELYPHAFGEGWGLYAEKLGIDMGLYDDPHADFGRLTYEMWRAGRLVVDTGIHSMGWTREQAVQLFVENSALSIHNINTEVDRYISWPGQALAYKMGELTILRLRARAEETLGDRFDIRAFHDAVLAAGGVPMTVLEARIDAWIASQSVP